MAVRIPAGVTRYSMIAKSSNAEKSCGSTSRIMPPLPCNHSDWFNQALQQEKKR